MLPLRDVNKKAETLDARFVPTKPYASAAPSA